MLTIQADADSRPRAPSVKKIPLSIYPKNLFVWPGLSWKKRGLAEQKRCLHVLMDLGQFCLLTWL